MGKSAIVKTPASFVTALRVRPVPGRRRRDRHAWKHRSTSFVRDSAFDLTGLRDDVTRWQEEQQAYGEASREALHRSSRSDGAKDRDQSSRTLVNARLNGCSIAGCAVSDARDRPCAGR